MLRYCDDDTVDLVVLRAVSALTPGWNKEVSYLPAEDSPRKPRKRTTRNKAPAFACISLQLVFTLCHRGSQEQASSSPYPVKWFRFRLQDLSMKVLMRLYDAKKKSDRDGSITQVLIGWPT